MNLHVVCIHTIISEYLEDNVNLLRIFNIKAPYVLNSSSENQFPVYSSSENFQLHNLKKIHMNKFGDGRGGAKGGLEPLRGAPLSTVQLNSFKGDLSPLQSAPIKYISLNYFNGDLEPLRGAPIKQLYLGFFNDDLSPLRDAPIENLHLGFYTGDLEPLSGAPLVQLNMYIFNGDLEPLRGSLRKLQKLRMNSFNKSLEPLQDCKMLKYIRLDLFKGSLEPLKNCNMLKCIKMPSFVGSLEPLKRMNELEQLKIYATDSLEPLQGIPLQKLCIRDFRGVLSTGFEPLRGAPLKRVRLFKSKKDVLDIENVSAAIASANIILADDVSSLRSITKIGYFENIDYYNKHKLLYSPGFFAGIAPLRYSL